MVSLPLGEIYDLLKKQLDDFIHLNSQTRLEQLKELILQLRHRDKT
jgi:hypothetical protein